MNTRFFNTYMLASIGLATLFILVSAYIANNNSLYDAHFTIVTPAIITALITFLSVFIASRKDKIAISPKLIKTALIGNASMLAISAIVIYIFLINDTIAVVIEVLLFGLCLFNTILLIAFAIKMNRGYQEEDSEKADSRRFSISYFFSSLALNLSFQFAIIHCFFFKYDTIWYDREYLPVVVLAFLFISFIFAILVFCITLFFKKQKSISILSIILLLVLLLPSLFILDQEFFRQFKDSYWEPSTKEESNITYSESYSSSSNYVERVSESSSDDYEEETKPFYFTFLAEGGETSMDSVRSAARYFSKDGSFNFSYANFPSRNFDYNAQIEDSLKNKSWKLGKLPCTKILSFFDKNRSSLDVDGIFMAYKDFIKLAVSQEKYDAYYKGDINKLLMAYSDIEDHDGFEEIYSWMSDDDMGYDDVYNRMQYMISRESFSTFIREDYASRTSFVLTYSFWGRRWREGNADACARALSKIQSMYYESDEEYDGDY